VAAYFGEHFVAAHQQVGSFEVVNKGGTLQKNGGNVASYFCTPDGRVIEAVSGPVSGAKLLKEAQWAVEAYRRSAASGQAVEKSLAAAHRDALLDLPPEARGRSPEGRIHQLLAERPLPPVNSVYRTIFEDIVGQRVDGDSTGLVAVHRAFEEAGARELPILFILHKEANDDAVLNEWDVQVKRSGNEQSERLAKLAAHYVVVAFPLRDVPALSSQLRLRPFAAPDSELPLFVIARSDGRQLSAVTSWKRKDDLAFRLAQGLVQEAKERARTQDQLIKLRELVAEMDTGLASQVTRLLKEKR